MWDEFVALVDGAKLSTLVAMIFANVALGVGLAVFTGQFRLKAVGDFLLLRVLPYGLGYFAIGMVALMDNTWEPALIATWVFVVGALTGHLAGQLRELGLPLPEFLAGNKPDAG